MSQPLTQPELQTLLASKAEALVERLVHEPDRRAECIGAAFIACREAAESQPETFHDALAQDALDAFLLPPVRTSLSCDEAAAPRGGWLGTYIGPDGRAIETTPIDGEDADSTDLEALKVTRQALARGTSIAIEQGNETLQRNLRWYRERLAHRSYDAIARAEGKVPATVRTGVARARKFLLRVVHDLQHAQPAPLDGDAPLEIEELRRLWVEQDLETLARELERTREHYSEDPQWLNLAALLAADRGHHAEAMRLYERALLVADASPVRGRVLNNLGNLRDDLDDGPGAARYWLRARRLVPHAPAPLLNLLAGASERRDYASAQHYIAEISELLNAGRLTREERSYITRRLGENPRFAWLRETDAWRLGPARWLRACDRIARSTARVLAATATAFLVTLLVLQPGIVIAGSLETPGPSAARRVALDERGAAWVAERGPQGGDSMGKPRKRAYAPSPIRPAGLLAGDSMGRSGGRPPRGRGSS